MEKHPYQEPPSYMDAVNSTVNVNTADATIAHPINVGFAPPMNQPIATAPPLSYGTIPQNNVNVVHRIVVVNGCPACLIGVLEENYSCCGICCAIACFPIGIICCLLSKNKRCSNCGTEF